MNSNPQAIPLPNDFPVEWDAPEDANRYWTRDRMHQPFAMPILAGDFFQLSTGVGMNLAHEHYGRPIRMDRSLINCYMFASVRMAVPPAEIPKAGRQGEQNTLAALPTIWERWESEWLPEVKELLDAWDGFDLVGASVQSLRDHLSESFEKSARCWHIHFLLAPLISGPSSIFRDLYTDLFGEDRGLESHGLTLAEDNKSLETDRELWVLSQYLRSLENFRPVVDTGNDEDLRELLGERLDQFLMTYGHRSGDGSGMAGLSWIEEPSPVLATIRAYARTDSPDPRLDHSERLADRDRLIDTARENLAGYPESVREQFDQALILAQQGSRLQEDHAYWIDQQTNARTHYVTMEAGRRLVNIGAIGAAEDVNHLGLNEILEALDRLAAGDGVDLNSLVQERTADLEYWSKIDAPVEIGVRPTGARPDTATSRGQARFFGTPVEQDDDPATVHGTPASPGTVEGMAKIVITLADTEKLSPGDIMVAPTTSPPWTPLFRIASAVVTDAGGVLSHCAIVAREYGIPAVVGTGVGPSNIKDGQQVLVDGDAGLIRILD
ncbi:MAG: hypothetical protein HOE75_00425 [Chloroflexi bacterium]|nr:hypothetical protein [Chloroflexota bacterium]